MAGNNQQDALESEDASPDWRTVGTITESGKPEVAPEVEQELRNLSMTMQQSRVQRNRMQNFAFEPMSLPGSQAPSRTQSPSGIRSDSVASGTGPTPPLTPAGTQGRELKDAPRAGSGANLRREAVEQATPISPQKTPPTQSTEESRSRSRPSSRPSSKPSSRSATPPSSHIGEDRYARIQAQARMAEAIDPSKFAVPQQAQEASHRHSSAVSLDQMSQKSGSVSGASKHHGLFGSKRHHEEDGKHGDSMSNLKRFFKVGGNKHHKDRELESASRKPSKTGASTPPQQATHNVPFADDHGLQSKYGKFGKVLGSGAGGSVRLMKRSTDGVTFAVKQFRARHPTESEKEYNKKVTAEFCIGSTLHHGNIIETMDIVHEKGSWFEVMEYAPFDLFAIVMTGKMSKAEVNCCTMQILSGITYLHSMGLAHRDLKLDNVVVNDQGIMKLIDFGSAVVFRYPFEDDVVKATGIVGSDPYLAPEVYDNTKYDPQAVDIWSFAIIYCCMTLRRFPWKAPRLSDVSYKLFVSPPNPGQPGPEDIRHKSVSDLSSSEVMSRDDSPTAPDIRPNKQQQQQQQQQQQGGRHASESTASDKSTQPTIKGPWRLLRLLPRETRHIIGRMLETDPDERATLDEIYADAWVSDTPCCEQGEGGKVIRAPGHEHVLEPGSSGSK